MKNIIYQSADGKNKPRNFVVAGGLIFLCLLFLSLGSEWLSAQSQLMVRSTPRPVPAGTFTPTVAAATPEAASAGTGSNCPGDSSNWNLVDVFQNNNYKRIDPPCVYAGLNKPVAWLLAAQGAGYTNGEAFGRLGFAHDLPYDNSQARIDLLPGQGNEAVAITTSWSPLHKDYRDWYVVSNSVTSDIFTITGCYRTYDTAGNRTIYWSTQWKDSGATMICELAEDRQIGWDVSAINGLIFSKQGSAPTRAISYFVYDNRPEYRSWYFVGYGRTIVLTAPVMLQTQADLQIYYHSPLWDLAWLESTYGLAPRALPQNWQLHTSLDDFSKILAILNQ